MSADLTVNLLQYLVSQKDGKFYIDIIDPEIFSNKYEIIVFKVLRDFYRKYNSLPSYDIAKEYFSTTVRNARTLQKGDDYNILNLVDHIYIPLNEQDIKYIQSRIRDIIVKRTTQKAVLSYSKGEIGEKELNKKISATLGIKETNEEIGDNFLIADFDKFKISTIKGYPTFLESLNELTAAGGFYSPQLIVFMSSPKHFKTGMMIKLAVEYARDGLNIYYADNENGIYSIRNRILMAITEEDLNYVTDPDNEPEIKECLNRFKMYGGGDFYIDSFAPNLTSLQAVSNKIDYLIDIKKFKPDIIIYDILDKFAPTNYEKEKRLRIQEAYNEAISINKKYGVFSFTPSQVTRNALDKKVLKMNDIAEDYGKIANAHAVFAICGTPEEVEQGVRRIIPVAQREGKKYSPENIAVIKIDETRMIVEEILNKEQFIYY